jgi:hypothetical protein
MVQSRNRRSIHWAKRFESRLIDAVILPSGTGTTLESKRTARFRGCNLRQHLMQTGAPETPKGLQTTAVVKASAQKEFSPRPRELPNLQREVVAWVDCANGRITSSLERRARILGLLLTELRNVAQNIGIPLTAIATTSVEPFWWMSI